MSKHSTLKSKNNKKTLEIGTSPETSDDENEATEIDDEVEVIRPTKMKQSKKPISDELMQKKRLSMNNARLVKEANLKERKQNKLEQMEIVARAYELEVHEKLKKTMLPKYERSIKKKILEKLKADKVAELKIKYNIKTNAAKLKEINDEEPEEESEDESEDEIIVRKKKPVKETSKPEVKPVLNIKKVSTLEKYRLLGF